MDLLKNIDLGQWILAAGVAVASCAISALTLMILKKFDYLSTEHLLADFVVIAYVTSMVFVYCINKFIRRSKRRRTSVTDILLEELSDIRETFYNRRVSYPLQKVEKMYYVLKKFEQISDANSSLSWEARANSGSFHEQTSRADSSFSNEQTSRADSSFSNEQTSRADSSLFHVETSGTGSPVLHEHIEKNEFMNQKREIRYFNPKQMQDKYPSETLRQYIGKTEDIELLGSLTMDDTLSPQEILEVNSKLSGESVHYNSKVLHDTSTDVSGHETNFQQQSENQGASPSVLRSEKSEGFLQNMSPEIASVNVLDSSKIEKDFKNKETTDNLQTLSSGISSGIALDPSKLEKELKNKKMIDSLQEIPQGLNRGIILDPSKLQKEFLQASAISSPRSSDSKVPGNTGVSECSPSKIYPNSLQVSTIEMEMKDFASEQTTDESYESSTGSPKNVLQQLNNKISGLFTLQEELTTVAYGYDTEEQLESESSSEYEKSVPGPSENLRISDNIAFNSDLKSLQRSEGCPLITGDGIVSPENLSTRVSQDLMPSSPQHENKKK